MKIYRLKSANSDEFELDERIPELRQGNKACDLSPKDLELFLYLVKAHPRWIRKAELLGNFWADEHGKVIGGDGALVKSIERIRGCMGDTGKDQDIIETRRGEYGGYRIRPTVKVIRYDSDPAEKVIWILELKATIGDIDMSKAEALLSELRRLSGDIDLKLQKIEPGSVRLILEGSKEGFEFIKSLVIAEQLTEVLGIEIQDIRQVSPPKQVLPPKLKSKDGRRVTGRVKWFSDSRGYGFIESDEGEDIFIHYTAIEGEGVRSLSEGQEVEFDIVPGPTGLQAYNVVRKVS